VSTSNARIEACFKALAREGRGGLVTFITAGDPDGDISAAILRGLPGAGADMIELGMPFSDPMADGPAIQAASLRALANGHTMAATLAMVREFRRGDGETPVILMGYYNPIHSYGIDAFVADAAEAGTDGLIIVDLPPEEDAVLRLPAAAAGIDLIRLATPTSDDKRLPVLMGSASGFVYYVSVAGVTGTKSAASASVADAVARIRRHTDLPVAVGFGIRTPEQVGEVARIADAAVVGSAIVDVIADGSGVESVLEFVAALSAGVGRPRSGASRKEAAST